MSGHFTHGHVDTICKIKKINILDKAWIIRFEIKAKKLKKFIVEKNPRTLIEEHILQGDTSDGVPNVLSPDNTFTDGLRQTPLRKKLRDLLVEDTHSQGDEIYRNYLRNKKMIDLRECPDTIKTDIINKFDDQEPVSNKAKVFPFLVNKQCRLLLENVQEFIN